MKEKPKRAKENIRITFTDKDGEVVRVVRSKNLLLTKFYNICLDHLRPWTNLNDHSRKHESWGWSVSEIRVGSGHHVEGDDSSPLPPRPEWADPYKCVNCSYESDKALTECPRCGSILKREWSDIEIEEARTPILVDTKSSAGSIIFTGVFTSEQANTNPLTEIGLYLANGELLAISTFRAIKKPVNVAMKVEWEISFGNI